ncbi:MAG: cadherin-like beta sandwich domain-containing protein [Oscillospiraceae bacterium]|nr:cadherin-like beta sandwich domain-containing protein [Oscillospiraceae bacterium]
MKKFRRILGIVLLTMMFTAILSPVASAAGNLSVRLAPNKNSVAPGEAFNINVNMVGVNAVGGVAAAEIDLSFDSARFSFEGAAIGGGKPSSDLTTNISGGKLLILYYDGTAGSNYYKADATLATLTFKVKAAAATGAASFSAAVRGGEGTFVDGKLAPVTSVTFSGATITVKNKPSANNNLKSLSIGNATLKPSFNAGTTSYTADVGFDVERLVVNAIGADSGAKITYSNPALKAGGTTKSTVTVTAASGAKKVYTITVTRAEDPDATTEPKSKENTLLLLKVDGGELSPVFAPEILEYLVQLPLGTQKAVITATPKESKAKIDITGADNLKLGANLAVVKVTADDGSVREYKITLNVGADITTAPTTGREITFPTTSYQPPVEPAPTASIAWWWLVVVFLGGLVGGVLLEHFVLPALDKKRQF